MSLSDVTIVPRASLRAGVARSTARHATAAGLAGSALAERFCFWRGRSGRRYVFSVYRTADPGDLAATPRYVDAVVIAAERRSDGTRRVVRILQTGSIPELTLGAGAAADRDGTPNELHFHLLAGTAAERRRVAQDLDEPA